MVKTKKEFPAGVPETFNTRNYRLICDHLARNDKDLKSILRVYGYPPMWTRGNSFETLVHIILEQQVSLASALAALNKLKKKTKKITAGKILLLTDEELRACFVSRQKTVYVRGLADAIQKGEINLEEFEKMSNDDIRVKLTSLKGIGNWTTDVYLMFALQRVDVFPVGDLAAVNAMKRLKKLAPSASREEILEISEGWKPFRSVASMMLWHYYLSNTSKKTAPVD